MTQTQELKGDNESTTRQRDSFEKTKLNSKVVTKNTSDSIDSLKDSIQSVRAVITAVKNQQMENAKSEKLESDVIEEIRQLLPGLRSLLENNDKNSPISLDYAEDKDTRIIARSWSNHWSAATIKNLDKIVKEHIRDETKLEKFAPYISEGAFLTMRCLMANPQKFEAIGHDTMVIVIMVMTLLGEQSAEIQKMDQQCASIALASAMLQVLTKASNVNKSVKKKANATVVRRAIKRYVNVDPRNKDAMATLGRCFKLGDIIADQFAKSNYPLALAKTRELNFNYLGMAIMHPELQRKILEENNLQGHADAFAQLTRAWHKCALEPDFRESHPNLIAFLNITSAVDMKKTAEQVLVKIMDIYKKCDTDISANKIPQASHQEVIRKNIMASADLQNISKQKIIADLVKDLGGENSTSSIKLPSRTLSEVPTSQPVSKRQVGSLRRNNNVKSARRI